VTAGKTVTNVVQNIDLYPTFVRLGRASIPPSVDGLSLVPLLGSQPVPFWRDAALIEHHGPDVDPNDPDAPLPGSRNPPSYEAPRLPESTYVEYANGEVEYYDLHEDPYAPDEQRLPASFESAGFVALITARTGELPQQRLLPPRRVRLIGEHPGSGLALPHPVDFKYQNTSMRDLTPRFSLHVDRLRDVVARVAPR